METQEVCLLVRVLNTNRLVTSYGSRTTRRRPVVTSHTPTVSGFRLGSVCLDWNFVLLALHRPSPIPTVQFRIRWTPTIFPTSTNTPTIRDQYNLYPRRKQLSLNVKEWKSKVNISQLPKDKEKEPKFYGKFSIT